MEVQNQPQVYVSSLTDKHPVRAKKDVDKLKQFREPERDVVDIEDAEFEEAFDKDSVERDRDKKLEEIKKQQQALEDAAAQIEETGVIGSNKAGKGLRFISTVLGLAATFVVAKGSSKIAIETLKSVAKSGSIKKGVEAIAGMKEPVQKVFTEARKVVGGLMENPKIKDAVTKLADSKIGKTVKTVLENKNVEKVLEPLKNTIASVKDIKINGKTIQSATENTMATITTGSVLVDNLTGRNNNKSNVELATGV